MCIWCISCVFLSALSSLGHRKLEQNKKFVPCLHFLQLSQWMNECEHSNFTAVIFCSDVNNNNKECASAFIAHHCFISQNEGKNVGNIIKTCQGLIMCIHLSPVKSSQCYFLLSTKAVIQSTSKWVVLHRQATYVVVEVRGCVHRDHGFLCSCLRQWNPELFIVLSLYLSSLPAKSNTVAAVESQGSSGITFYTTYYYTTNILMNN